MSKKKKNKKKGNPNPALTFEIKDRILAFWKKREAKLTFILKFVLLLILFYVFFTSSFFQENIFAPVNQLNASVAAFILNLLGQNVTAFEQTIKSAAFSVNISIGCDGVEPIFYYILTVALTPMLWSSRIKGILLGAAILFLINLLRIVTLFLTGVYAPDLFDLMHLDVWQALFLFITIGCYLLWLNYAYKKQSQTPNAEH